MGVFDDMSKVSPKNLQMASILMTAMMAGAAHVIHMKTKEGKEVDVLAVIADEPIGGIAAKSIVPVAIMINNVDDFEIPKGTIRIGPDGAGPQG